MEKESEQDAQLLIETKLREESNYLEWTEFHKNIKNYIPLEVIDVAKNLFTKVAKGAETLDSSQLVILLRLMDLNPTDKDVTSMLNNLNVNPELPKDKFNFYEFVTCVARCRRQSNTLGELMSAFKLLDKEATGKIPEPTLRYNLCKKGEMFSNEEMDLFMKEAAPFTELINDIKYLNYQDFGLYLKDMYVPKEVVDPKKKKGK